MSAACVSTNIEDIFLEGFGQNKSSFLALTLHLVMKTGREATSGRGNHMSEVKNRFTQHIENLAGDRSTLCESH